MSRPYPRYRDSGVEWLGDVPEHWEVKSFGMALAETIGGGTPDTGREEFWAESDEDGMLWVAISDMSHGGVVEATEKRVTPAGIYDARLRPLPAGTIIYSMYASVGAVARLATRAITNQAILGLVPRETLLASFLYWWLGGIRKPVLAFTRSNTQSNLNAETVRKLPVVLPYLDEQRAIVAFLDGETERIDALVAKQRRLIERLHEYRTALITRTTTRGLPPEAAHAAGLDPSPRLKPSGVEWLGDVPEHWKVLRLSYLATKFGSGITPRGGATIYQETGIPFLRSQNIHFDGLRIQDVARIAPSLHRELASSHVKPGDVLLNITGASIGRVCSVPDNFAEGNVNQHVCIVRPNQNRLLPDILAAYLSTPAMQREIQFEQSGASREGLTLQSIRNFKIVVPPLPEQIAIVGYLDAENTRLRGLTTQIEAAIERLQEYRTALITAAVTGKIDVRDAAREPVAATTR